MPITYVIRQPCTSFPLPRAHKLTQLTTCLQAISSWISGLFALVMVFMLYSLSFSRRRPDEEGDGLYITRQYGTRNILTAVPLVLVVGFAIWGFGHVG